MAKEFNGQFDNEEVLFVFKRHPIVMRKGLIIVMVTVLVGALVGLFLSRNTLTISDFIVQFFTPVAIGIVLGALAFSYYWIGWYHSVCIVTNIRLIQINQVGIFKRREVNDIDLKRILSVNYEVRGLLENVLGFGTIIIQTLVGDLYIAKVPRPAQTQSKIVTAIKESGVELDENTELEG